MPILTQCPTCRRQLRVPDELLGRNVKCPECLAVFIAATDTDAREPEHAGAEPEETPAASSVEAESDDFYDDEEDDEDIPRRRNRRRAWRARAREDVAGPAVGLIVISAIDILLAFFLVFSAAIEMARAPDAPAAGERAAPPNRRQRERDVNRDEQMERQVGGVLVMVWGVIALLCGVLTMVSGLLMKGLRGYGLAMTCCALSVIPCTAPCFVASIPIGIWGLVVLNRHEVRASFD
jgi:predicted Zn finger-like uncharacterized protein